MNDPSVVDPDMVVHHEFANGEHGRKADYDKIPDGSELFIQWMGLFSRTIISLHPGRLPDALVGVANGGNRIAQTAAYLLGSGVTALTTEKTNENTVRLDGESLAKLAEIGIKYALIVDDVGTTGGTMLTAAQDLQEHGVTFVKALNGHQRTASLPRLRAADVEYDAMMVDTSLPTFTEEQCKTLPNGYCAKKVRLVRHK